MDSTLRAPSPVVANLRTGKKVINMGWGQRHPLDGVEFTRRIFGWTLPKEYIMVYCPRTDEELQIVMEIVKASAGYMTNTHLAVHEHSGGEK
jgi:hypothetical protein